MNVLIVEDDENKLGQIVGFIIENVLSANIVKAHSYQGGLRQLKAGSFDLVIMDMSMPTYDVTLHEEGGRPQAYAGRELLRQMTRRRISTPVIVVTQYDRFGEGSEARTFEQLDAELAVAHPSTYMGMVYYNSALEGWKEELEEKLRLAGSER